MKKNRQLLLALLRMRLQHLTVFRLSFFGAFFVDGSLFLIQLLLFDVLYGQVDSIGGWSKGQMIVFVGTFSLVNALCMSTFFFGIISLPEKICTGSLDQYLVKPSSLLLRLSFEKVNPGSLPLIALSLVILLRGVALMGQPVSVFAVIAYIIAVLLMTLLWYDLMLIFRTLPFFILSAAALGHVEESFIEMSMKVPGVIFQGVWKVLFYGLLPYGLIATLPTQIITGAFSAGGIAWGLLIVALFTLGALRFFRFGLSQYKSTGS